MHPCRPETNRTGDLWFRSNRTNPAQSMHGSDIPGRNRGYVTRNAWCWCWCCSTTCTTSRKRARPPSPPPKNDFVSVSVVAFALWMAFMYTSTASNSAWYLSPCKTFWRISRLVKGGGASKLKGFFYFSGMSIVLVVWFHISW